MISVELFAKPKPNNRHWYAYDLLLDGETIVSNSRDPEHDLARALLARGISGVVEVRDGKTGTARSRVNIEKAAKCCIGSNLERYKWKAPEASDSSPHACESVLANGRATPQGISLTHRAIELRFPQKNFPDERDNQSPPRGAAT
jgi:hypothetical protein